MGMRGLLAALLGFVLVAVVQPLGCMAPICADRNPTNELRQCDAHDCSHFHTPRWDLSIGQHVDVRCQTGDKVYAPVDGELQFYRPHGRNSAKKCADQGARIDGSGQWQGYQVYISPLRLDRLGGAVKAGQQIGWALDPRCYNNSAPNRGKHVEVKLIRHRRTVDPTHHLNQCMCTGQICESNRLNRVVGQHFKNDKRYNGVRGWELECDEVYDSLKGADRAPKIYAPIDGRIVGRHRLEYKANGHYEGCDNDALFIQGTDKWADFEARLYNVAFSAELGVGERDVKQGSVVGRRLTCDGSPDTVFLEIRYRGRLVDVSDVILAQNCRLPAGLDE